MRPLRRRPKQLTEPPTAFDATRGVGGLVLRADGTGQAPARDLPGASGRDFTDDEAAAAQAEGRGVDREAQERARAIAARLSVPRPRREASARRGAGELGSLPYRGGGDDLDLDRTLEALVGTPRPEETDIVVRDRFRTRRAVVLLADVSGSMRGERVRTMAATVGALASELDRELLAVIAFWSDAATLLHLGAPVRPQQLLSSLLALPAQGLTNIAFPLELAAKELAGVPARDARAILLSDAVHNAGPDPRPLAARLPRLDVLLDASGEHDVELARDLARAGRGRLRAIRDHRQAAAAIGALFERDA